jgi:hypothetical protein
MKPPNYMPCLARIGSVTVNLLNASGKREFRRDSAGFLETQWLARKEIANRAASQLRTDKRLLCINTM